MSSTSLPVLEPKVPPGGIPQGSGDLTAMLVDRLAPSSAEARAQGLLDAFDFLACGAILLAASGRVDRLNRSAQAHLGRGFVLVHDRLRAQVRHGDDAL